MEVSFVLDAFDTISSHFENREIFLVNLVGYSLKEGVKNPLKGKDLGKILSGERNISRDDASFILDKDNFAEKNLDFYIEKELKTGNEQYNRDNLYAQISSDSGGLAIENMTKDNVEFYLKQIWLTYLKKCANAKQKRNSRKNISVNSLEITERFRKVVEAINGIDDEKSEYTDPLHVDEKIEKNIERPLFKKIQNNVMDYFSDIKQLFIEEQESKDLVYEQIRKKVKYQYKHAIGKYKHEVFDNLANWLMAEVQSTDREACEAVMSYFVQSCEVFGK